MLVGAEVGLLVGEFLVFEKVLRSELGLASLGVEDAEALVEEGLEDVEVVDEAAAEFVESAEITVSVEYGYESRLVVALVEQQSCP